METFSLVIRSLGVEVVTVHTCQRQSAKVSLFCHYSPVKMSEIKGTQVKSKTVQVIGWQEDLFNFLALAEGLRSV
jgi:hypothetical protein